MNYIKIPVLLYHSVNGNGDANEIDTTEFEKQILYFKKK